MQINDYLGEELEHIKKAGLWRQMEVAEDLPSAARIVIEGRQMINLCSNNYLGLAGHPEVKKAACQAIERWGASATASSLMAGHTELHRRLEEKISEFKKTQGALTFSSGYLANLGIISALVGPGDVVFSDRLNHASIVDGIILSRAILKRYRHNDVGHLEKLLREESKKGKGENKNKDKKMREDDKERGGAGSKNKCKDKNNNIRLIVTDTVFSMDGDIAPLPEIVSLAREYDCLLMVDEAHATGVLGPGGRGGVEHFGLEGQVAIQMGTLSKALGAQGGYVTGSKQLIDYLINKSRPFIYTTSLTPSMAEAALKALQIIDKDSSFRNKLWQNVNYFRDAIVEAGFDTGPSQTQIIPIIIGQPDKAIEFSRLVYQEDIFARAIRPPTVPKDKARIRVSLTAGHTQADLEKVVQVFAKTGRKLRLV